MMIPIIIFSSLYIAMFSFIFFHRIYSSSPFKLHLLPSNMALNMAFFTGFLPFLTLFTDKRVLKRIVELLLAIFKGVTSIVVTPVPDETNKARRKRELISYGLMTLCLFLQILHSSIDRLEDNMLVFPRTCTLRSLRTFFYYPGFDQMGNRVFYLKSIKQISALSALVFPIIWSIYMYEFVRIGLGKYGITEKELYILRENSEYNHMFMTNIFLILNEICNRIGQNQKPNLVVDNEEEGGPLMYRSLVVSRRVSPKGSDTYYEIDNNSELRIAGASIR